MNEVIPPEMAMIEASTGNGSRMNRLFRVVMVLQLLMVLALGVCLLFGISPLGRQLQSVEWVYQLAKLFCC